MSKTTAAQLAQPMPNDRLFGYTVIASTIYRDTDEHGNRILAEYTALLLHPGPPYYSVVIIGPSGNPYLPWRVDAWVSAKNIGEATDQYRDHGGDA